MTRIAINGTNGKAGKDVDDRAGYVGIETTIGLEGRADVERLEIGDDRLIVRNGEGRTVRHWPLDQLDAVRIEPSVGSCFVQAQCDGEWVDVLRRPGGADAPLREWVDRINAHVSGLPVAVSPADKASGEGTPRHWRTASRLLFLLRPFYRSVVLLVALSLAAVAIEVAPPMLLGLLVDRVLGAGAVETTPQQQLLLYLLAIVAGLFLVRSGATLVAIWKGYVSSRVGTAMTADLRDELVEKLNELPLAFHDRNQVGRLMSQVAYDTETLHTLVYHMTSGLMLQSLQLVGIGVMLFYLNTQLAVIALLPMPLILAGGLYFTRYLQPRYHHYWEAVGKQASALMGMLSGIRVVKAFVQENREIRRFRESSHRLRDSRVTVDVSTSTFTAAMGFLFAIGSLAVWYLGGRNVLAQQMSLGELMAFLQYVAMFYTPLTSITESTTWFANFFGTSRRTCDLLETPSEQLATSAAVKPIRGEVALEHVSFGYDKSRPVLKDISFAIGPGQMIGVVGRSGCGKSTLVSLLGRLYDADAGRILIDGIDVREMNPRQLRRQIGMVPQESFLFRGLVAENIAYGDSEATPAEIIRAAKWADAHEFIMRMPFGYETQLGEGGSGLSGGERQRLAIARALLFDPAILILDEATASIDAESEKTICQSLRGWSGERTVIVISHRLTALQGADRLLVFDQGRLIEQGTEDELLSLGGLYSKLVNIQGSITSNRQQLESAIGVAELSESDDVDSSHEWSSPLAALATDGSDNSALHWLDPSAINVTADVANSLRISDGEQVIEEAYAVRMFGLNYPREFISLRRREASGRECEIGLIERLDGWPAAAQAAVDRSLSRRYLLRRIEAIRQIRTSENVLSLTVETDAGAASIRLEKPGEGAQPIGDAGLLLIDPSGNYYLIPDRNVLPKGQQRLLTLYLGD